MTTIKFTGANIAAAVLVLAYFFPWVSGIPGFDMSGFKLTTTGVSPGMLGMFVTGMNRLLMVLLVIIPLCAALILYQNITGNKKYNKYYKPAHLLPLAFLAGGLLILYFKLQPDTPDYPAEAGGLIGQEFNRSNTRMMESLTPGLFDILSVGVYLSLFAATYLFLVSTGKVQDKEYYRPQAAKLNTGNEPPPTGNG